MLVTITSSPGFISLSNSAPEISKAQLSDANTISFSVLPIQSGLNPCGSLTAISFFDVITINEYEPFSLLIVFTSASSIDFAFNLS